MGDGELLVDPADFWISVSSKAWDGEHAQRVCDGFAIWSPGPPAPNALTRTKVFPVSIVLVLVTMTPPSLLNLGHAQDQS